MSIPTIGGIATRGEVYTKLLHHLRECQDMAAVMAHLHNTEGNDADKLLAKGWLAVSEMMALITKKVTDMAMRKLQ